MKQIMRKSIALTIALGVCGSAVGKTVDNPELSGLTSLSDIVTNSSCSKLVNVAEWTISFDISDVTSSSGYLLSLSKRGDVSIDSAAWRSAGISISTNGNLQLVGVGLDASHTAETSLNVSDLSGTTLTLVGTQGDNSTALLTLYADGIQVAKTETSGASNWFNITDDAFANDGKLNVFFGKLGDTVNSASATYSNVYYSANTALTATQVASIIDKGNVPEPTTASLSLLALGALALRRRRQ